MTDRTRQTRRYSSPHRRRQAEATRRSVLVAAQRLFEHHGYAATKMEAIAAEAGVSLKTVYVAFSTKAGLLRAVWELLSAEDERVVDREAIEEPDAERTLRQNARNTRELGCRLGGLIEVIQSAALVDADGAALWRQIQSDTYAHQRAIVERLAVRHALRPELDVSRATDILWTLHHPNVWLLLVTHRGWTPDQFEQWLADTTCAQLL